MFFLCIDELKTHDPFFIRPRKILQEHFLCKPMETNVLIMLLMEKVCTAFSIHTPKNHRETNPDKIPIFRIKSRSKLCNAMQRICQSSSYDLWFAWQAMVHDAAMSYYAGQHNIWGISADENFRLIWGHWFRKWQPFSQFFLVFEIFRGFPFKFQIFIMNNI